MKTLKKKIEVKKKKWGMLSPAPTHFAKLSEEVI
jgi:hypothetical protein